MLGGGPDGPLGPLNGGQMELLKLLDKGQKGFLGLWVGARIATESTKCKIKAFQILHFLTRFVIKTIRLGVAKWLKLKA